MSPVPSAPPRLFPMSQRIHLCPRSIVFVQENDGGELAGARRRPSASPRRSTAAVHPSRRRGSPRLGRDAPPPKPPSPERTSHREPSPHPPAPPPRHTPVRSCFCCLVQKLCETLSVTNSFCPRWLAHCITSAPRRPEFESCVRAALVLFFCRR